MRPTRGAALLVTSLLAFAWTAGSASAQAAPPPTWAPASQAAIHPGVQTVSESGQCTSNFVFFDATDVYIGQAAHCTSTESINQVNGCETDVLPVGALVRVEGATRPAQVAYNSWVTMQEQGEPNENVCRGNDFALVRLDPADRGRVNPSVPFWGGPNGLDPSSDSLEEVYAYGSSQLRAGISALSPQYGFALDQEADGWTHVVFTATPGIPGDSGAAYLGSEGGALGSLSTFSVLLTNQVTDLSRALAYMTVHTDLSAVQLANGTEPFEPLLF